MVAHRGASDAEPEHTLAAYRRAVDAGADALECDVRLTADQHLVCVHDRTVNRTSDGAGLVSTLELAQLEGMDWGSWKRLASGDDGRPGQAGEVPDVIESSERSHLLTLRRLLVEVAEVNAKRPDDPVQVAVETKHPTRYGGLVERRLVQLLREFGYSGGTSGLPVRMMSFSSLAGRRAAQRAPERPLVYLLEHRIPGPVIEGSVPQKAALGIDVKLVRDHPRYVARLAARREVHVWTVDTTQDVELCLELGARAIITNRPALVRRELTLQRV